MADDIEINIGSNPAGVEAGSRRAKVAIKGVADGGKDLDAALRKLRTSIDPTFAAMERLNKTHADNLALLRAGLVTRKEYNAGMAAAKAAYEAETQAIQRNSAAGKAAAAEAVRLRQEQQAAARAAAQAEAQSARQAAQAKRQAEKEAHAEAVRLRAEERRLAREAAAAAKAAAREAAAAVRVAEQQKRAEIKATEKEAKRAAREATSAEKAEAKAAAEAIRQAERQKKAEVREAARTAATAAKEAAAAKKLEARAARDAAEAVQAQARAERQAADALTELRSSIDPAFASQARYNETMRRATDLLMQNKLKTGEWTAIQRQAKAQMDLNVRSMGRMNAMNVQMGYQMQDVVASFASGINPLVILAQQGGQTASALATMGGTAGRVAAFFAGPWGAAILGAVTVLGFLWQSQSEGETSTKDLMNAEDRRRMSLKELTQAIKEYTKAQKEANDTTEETARIQAQEAANARATLEQKLNAAKATLAEFEELRTSNPVVFAADGGVVALQILQNKVKSLQRSWNDARDAETEARAGYAQTVGEQTDLERQEAAAIQEVTDNFRFMMSVAQTDRERQAAQLQLAKDINDTQARFKKLKDDETAARRENAAAAREEAKAIFDSREDAIGVAGKELQRSGYNVGENFQFGSVGQHPGMGRQAHGLYAIDVNIPGAGTEAYDAVAKERMDKMVAAYQARGFRILWNGKVYNPSGAGASYDIPANQDQHKDHAHIEAPASIVGQSAGSRLGNQLAQDQARALEDALQERIAALEFEQELNREDLAQVLRIQQEKIDAITAFYGAESKEAVDANRERVRIERQANREILEDKRRDIEQRLALMLRAADVEQELHQMSATARGEVIDFAAQHSVISDREALIAKGQMLDEEYENQVTHETQIYTLKVQSLRAQLELQDMTVKQRQEILDQLETLEADHLGRLATLRGQHSADVNRMNMQSADLSLSKWEEVSSTLTSSMGSAFQGLWTRSITWQQAFINMADQMVYKIADMGQQMLQDWIMKQLGMTAVQQAQDLTRVGSAAASEGTKQAIVAATTTAAVAGEGIKTAAAVTGAATQTSVGATAGMAEIGTRAATSAAGAYSSTVVIPFIGPIAAPIAAGVALAAVLGFGALISARGGYGEVSQDGQLAQLHKKEMVLPAWIAEPMRQSIRTRGSGGLMSSAINAGSTVRENSSYRGGDNSFYYQPQHTHGRETGMDSLLRKDADRLRRWLKNEARNGNLKGIDV